MDCPDTLTGSARKRSSLRRAVAGLACVLVLGDAACADPELLPPEQAFRFSARALDDKTLEARFSVTDGYYLYRDKLAFAIDPPMTALAPPTLPAGKMKEDQFFGTVETYRGEIVVRLTMVAPPSSRTVGLVADSQGCADIGVCYPVNRQKVILPIPAAGKGPGPLVEAFPRKKGWFD
jgi:thiol:disulfide interchange protein DsbD